MLTIFAMAADMIVDSHNKFMLLGKW